MLAADSNATLTRCEFYGCHGIYGGALSCSDGSTAKLNDCVVAGCAAFGTCGGVRSRGVVEIYGSTIIGAAGSGGDVFVDTSGVGRVTLVNSIVGTYSGNVEVGPGCVVGVAPSALGFVAPPPDDLTLETWDANAWQNWNLRLLDDGSDAPSPYRDSGDVDAASKYDLDGNFRGRETNGVATRSPGAYETIQADLFWVGVDSTGAEVVSPSFLTSDGWSASRFATVSGDAAPQVGQTVFVDGAVVFSDVLSTEKDAPSRQFGLTLGGGANVRFPSAAVYLFDLQTGAAATFTFSNVRPNEARFGDWSRLAGTFSALPKYDVGSQVYIRAAYLYSFAQPSATYGILTVYAQKSPTLRLDGAYRCDEFRIAAGATPNDVCAITAPGTSVRARVVNWGSASSTVAEHLVSEPITLILQDAASLTLPDAAPESWADHFIVDLSEATSAALTLCGQTVYGDAPTAAVELTGSAKIDERGLDVASLALNADASLTVKNATVKTEKLAATNVTLMVADSSITANDSGIEDSTLTISENETEIFKASNIDISGGVVSSDFKLSIEVLDNNESGELSISEIELIADSISSAGGTTTFENSIVTANALSFTETFSEILNSTLNFDAIHFSNSTCVLGSTTVTAKSVIVNGTSTIDFTGEDSILRGAESLTLDDESRCNGVGYLVAPLDGQYFGGSQIGEDVRICDYGADAQSFSATANSATTANLDWNQSDEQSLILLETYDNGWKVLENNIGVDSSPYETTLTGAQRFRLFDGANFLYDEAYFAVKSFYVYTISSTQREIASYSLYSRKVQMVRANIEGSRNENVLLLAQIKNLLTGEYLIKANVESIVASVYKVEKGVQAGDVWTEQEDWKGREVPLDSLLESPIMIEGWTNDEIGANFIWTPNTMEKKLFTEGGKYVIQVTFNLPNENPIVISFNASVK